MTWAAFLKCSLLTYFQSNSIVPCISDMTIFCDLVFVGVPDYHRIHQVVIQISKFLLGVRSNVCFPLIRLLTHGHCKNSRQQHEDKSNVHRLNLFSLLLLSFPNNDQSTTVVPLNTSNFIALHFAHPMSTAPNDSLFSNFTPLCAFSPLNLVLQLAGNAFC